jgi:diguanylate cyclase (GGDEF)-like protein/PAS domain S-box-containing protein
MHSSVNAHSEFNGRLLCFVLAAILPFAGFIAWQGFEIREKRLAEAVQRAQHLAQIATGSFQSTIVEARLLLVNAARAPDVNGSAPSCSDTLALMQGSHPWANGMFVIGGDGIVRCTTVPGTLGVNFSDRDEYRMAKAETGFAVTDAFVGKVRRIPMTLATLPFVSAATGAKELLAVTIDLSGFDDLSDRVGSPSGARVFLLDSQATVISSYPRQPGLTGQPLPSASIRDAIQRAPSGEIETAWLDGNRVLAFHAGIPGSRLRVIVAFDQEVVLANLRRGLWQAIALFGIVAGATGSLVWFAGTAFFVKPLKRLIDLLSAALDNMDQGLMVVDADGKLSVCNARAIRLLDLPRSLVEKHPSAADVLKFQEQRGDFAGLPDEVRANVVPDESGRSTYERTTAAGTTIEVRSVPFAAGGIVRTYTDVSEKRAQERRLAEREAQYRLIAERSGDMIFQLDLDFVRRYVSPASLQLIGYAPEELVGTKPASMIHPDDVGHVQASYRAVADGAERAVVVNRIRHRNGTWKWVEGELTIVREPVTGKPSGIQGALRDISVRKASEDELKATHAQLAEAHRALEKVARQDGLTGLANRRHLNEILTTEVLRARRHATALSLVMIDIDHFKKFNDTYGHLKGDDCLCRVAEAIKRSAKRPGDVAARFGGEEFAVLLPETDAEGAQCVAETVCAAIRAEAITHAASPFERVTVSVGWATVAGHDVHIEHLVDAADQQLYEAKRSGRNCVKGPAANDLTVPSRAMA